MATKVVSPSHAPGIPRDRPPLSRPSPRARLLRQAGQMAMNPSACRGLLGAKNLSGAAEGEIGSHTSSPSNDSRAGRIGEERDLLDDLLEAAVAGRVGCADALASDSTFLTSDTEATYAQWQSWFTNNIGSEEEQEARLMRELQEAADAVLHGAGVTQGNTAASAPHPRTCESQAPSDFLSRLRVAHAEAIAAGDLESAAAVADAIRAEEAAADISDNTSCASQRKEAEHLHSNRQQRRPQPQQQQDHLHSQRPPRPAQSSPPLSARAGKPTGGNGDAASSKPLLTARSARNQRIIDAQFVTGTAQASDATPAGAAREERSTSSRCCIWGEDADQCSPQPREDDSDGDIRHGARPVRLGELSGRRSASAASTVSSECAKILRSARASQERRSSGGSVADSASVGVHWPARGHEHLHDNLEEQLPASDLPLAGREALRAWAWGCISGHRCLLEVMSTAPKTTSSSSSQPTSTTVGRASWSTLLAIAGLAGGEELFAAGGVRESLFERSPYACLQEACRGVREEAAVNGPVTMEELHLGLRALKLRACGGRSSGVRFNLLQAQSWRELFRAYVQGQDAHSSSGRRSCPAKALRRALGLGSVGVEQEARSEDLESLRELPPGWEDARSMLTRMIRSLKEDLEGIDTYGAYTMLGIEPDVSDAELRRAYRDLCLKHHPDKGGDTAAFQSLQQAHEKIVEDRKRGIRPPPKPKRVPTPPQSPARKASPHRDTWAEAAAATAAAAADAAMNAANAAAPSPRSPSIGRKPSTDWLPTYPPGRSRSSPGWKGNGSPVSSSWRSRSSGARGAQPSQDAYEEASCHEGSERRGRSSTADFRDDLGAAASAGKAAATEEEEATGNAKRQRSSSRRPPEQRPAPNAGDRSPSQPSASPGAASGAGRSCARPRSGSAGARGRCEALIRRRLDAFEELKSLNTEALGLQRRAQEALMRSPLLLPEGGVSASQHRRVFGVAADFLHEAAGQLSLIVDGSDAFSEFLSDLPTNDGPEVALLGARASVLRLAGLLDVHSAAALLEESFLEEASKRLEAKRARQLKVAVGRAAEALRARVAIPARSR